MSINPDSGPVSLTLLGPWNIYGEILELEKFGIKHNIVLLLLMMSQITC